MAKARKPESDLQDLVIGLAAPIGTDLDPVYRALASSFERLGYAPHEVRLSKHLDEVCLPLQLDLAFTTEEQRYNKYMTAGNSFRSVMKRGDALSMVAIGAIREIRKQSQSSKHAFVLRSLKHPDEVKSLRNIYGPAFVLFSLASSRTARVTHLAKRICQTHQEFDSEKYLPDAEKLINRDQQEAEEPLGQNVRKVFPMADFFVDVDHGMEEAVERLVEVLLGNVFITPTRNEYGMFLAHAAAWRSASLQRQVGAVIATQEGDVIAVGTNEVPKPQGGLYWEGDDPDFRDFKCGGEINDDMKYRMFVEVVQRILKSGMSYQGSDGIAQELTDETDPQVIAKWLIKNEHMDNTRIMSVIEFGRCVHAEMAAFMDAARRGVSVDGGILYSTTFPCHECARHIVAAGIRKVYYVEPYPKSLVNELYPDSIRIEGDAGTQFVGFLPFVGVAPRRYLDVFMLGEIDRRKLVQHANDWTSGVATPRLGEYPERTQKINILMEKAAFDQFSLEFKEINDGNN